MSEWYRWDTLAEAQACLNYVNNHPKLPVVGVNAATKKPAPDKQQTTQWASEVIECNDGKFGFPRVTTAWLDSLGITQEERDTFLATFNPTIEEFDPAWIPAAEEYNVR